MSVFDLLPVLLIVEIPLAFLSLHLYRLKGSRGGPDWALSWQFLWLSGIFLAIGPDVGFIPMRLTSALFSYFLLRGTLRFCEHRVPTWLDIVVGSMVALDVGLLAIGRLETGQLLGTLLDVALLLVAAGVVVRRDLGRNLAGWGFATSVVLLAIVNVLELWLYRPGVELGLALVFLWVSALFGIAVGELTCLESKKHRRLIAATQELEQERRDAIFERALLQAGLQTSPLGYCVTGIEGQILHLSAVRLRQGGLFDADWVGRPIGELVEILRSRTDLPEELNRIYDLLDGTRREVIRDLSVTINVADEARHLVFFASPIFDQEGGDMGTVVVTRDVTEEKALEADLRQAQKMETLGMLAGGLAHDLNNQLAVISGNIELAELVDGTERDELMNGISNSIDHCATMTRGMLSFASRTPVRATSIAANSPDY